ncbi:hypothetical protein CAPTEDRAFT_216147 [Capitella teleta]|uniref:Uncharacterized protein n=1 Tax=Capitella teleta TaxID=283909 RepID=R7UFY5_CAPTE|nr:hypothetical protein CAPTEDRAFT_216147 [Capitella teleta]|eukprot:ELU05095.1 hypothetical protein CAPTEDRAFT_216147 [Capitella teleta]
MLTAEEIVDFWREWTASPAIDLDKVVIRNPHANVEVPASSRALLNTIATCQHRRELYCTILLLLLACITISALAFLRCISISLRTRTKPGESQTGTELMEDLPEIYDICKGPGCPESQTEKYNVLHLKSEVCKCCLHRHLKRFLKEITKSKKNVGACAHGCCKHKMLNQHSDQRVTQSIMQ